jgi:uncharacterized LabA/DUF88 family protein
MAKIAILVDGGFYRRRAQSLWGEKTAEKRLDELIDYCYRHVNDKRDHQKYDLYRIFYYDCPPMEKKVYHPLQHKTIDFGRSELYVWMTEFLNALKGKRKVALRLGTLAEAQACYTLRSDTVKKLCNGSLSVKDLEEKHFTLDVSQKGVDMKIGVDIASLAYKKQVDKIVLISGDSDFVPAAKLARREGIDFVLDPMWMDIKPELFEHIDGLRSVTSAPKRSK